MESVYNVYNVGTVTVSCKLLFIDGDTHTTGEAPLRTLGQQPIQNAAPSQTDVCIYQWLNGANLGTILV